MAETSIAYLSSITPAGSIPWDPSFPCGFSSPTASFTFCTDVGSVKHGCSVDISHSRYTSRHACNHDV